MTVMATIILTDEQLAQFTATGLIVVDGEAEFWHALTDQVVTLTATCPTCHGNGSQIVGWNDMTAIVERCTRVVTLGRFSIRLLPVQSGQTGCPLDGNLHIWTDESHAYLCHARTFDDVVEELTLNPLPRPGQWVVQVGAA